ncbi:copper resistance protein CopC [Sinomonas sp. ASV486]|uniref:Copper resistance protein CopC n=1 Tax=Sinomonas puerhi TaxID=3238584 RepID=A0AB39L3N3_9MICC|nr:copper resistance protein CopC [Sinomonas sp. ASV486]MDQ4490183.1 copper resistance protein CopC [Sinomonas sp. ASV486]
MQILRRVRSVLRPLSALAAVGFILVVPAPAFAHDALEGSAPASGGYTAVWRAVSTDSHPIEDTPGFTVTSGSTSSTTPASPPGASTSPSVGPGIQASQPGTAQTPPAAPAAQGEPFPWAVVVFAVVAIGLLAALGVGARRRFLRGEDGGPGQG